jgi:alginate O-acetyltransferase complex protein AlgI
MSYVIDVYRGQVAAQRSFFKVLLYIAFFPQLIAGPIVRYHDIELQLANRKMTLVGCAYGFRRFCVGLGKKVLIANSMAVVVDAIFAAPQNEVNIAVAWVAAIAYILQIYFDFSGYSDMAIGLARIFGFEYKENFNYPYVSTSVKEFWRRWHISLSTWFKEYLYIPLGGNRKGRLRTCLNKIIVFFCCGLWHGAAWTFVIWGLIHGAFLLLEEYLPIKKLPKALGWIYTMLVITFAFVIFRADTWPQAVFMMGQMLTGFSFNAPSMQLLMQQLTPVFLVSIVCAIIAATPIKTKLNALAQSAGKLQIWDAVTFVLCILLFAISVLSLASGAYNPFIYFRF